MTPRQIYRARLEATRTKTYLFTFGAMAVTLLFGLLIASGLVRAPIDPEFSHAPTKPTYFTIPCVPSDTPTPVALSQVEVRVFNATDQSGLAGSVAKELKDLNVKVSKVGNTSAFMDDTAQIRTSVQALREAYSLAEVIPGAKVVLVPTTISHPERLDLLLGDGFTKVMPKLSYDRLDPGRSLLSGDDCTDVDPDFIAQERQQLSLDSPVGTADSPTPEPTK